MKRRSRKAPPTKPPTCAMNATPPWALFIERVGEVDDEVLSDDEPRRQVKEEPEEEPQK